MLMVFLSLLCSLLLFLTGWTGLTFFVFGPLSLYFAWKSYKRTVARGAGRGRRLVALIPMFIAIATFPLTMAFIQATYRA